jgi:hypothetical protein
MRQRRNRRHERRRASQATRLKRRNRAFVLQAGNGTESTFFKWRSEMSWKQPYVVATFAGSLIAMGVFADAQTTFAVVVNDESSSSGQGEGSGQRDVATSGGDMQSNNDALPSSGNLDSSSKMAPQSNSASGSNLRMQQNSGGMPTNPESNRTRQGGGNDPLSGGNTIDPSKGNSPGIR